jgi:hypothetical protein
MHRAWLLLALVLVACSTDQGGPGEPFRLLTTSLPPAYLGQPYQVNFIAEGGIRPYSFSLGGRLPQGLSATATGIQGTPLQLGNFTLTLGAEDAGLSTQEQNLTLQVLTPPPPSLQLILPRTAISSPFILAVRTQGGQLFRAFQARFVLPKLTPELTTFKAAPGLLYVIRYNPKTSALDLDGAFQGPPRKDQELFQITLSPQTSTLPQVNPIVIFYDQNWKAYPDSPTLQRTKTSGTYGFPDLIKLAQATGQGPVPGFPGKTLADDLALLQQSYLWVSGGAKPAPPAVPKLPSLPVQSGSGSR